MDSHGEAQYSLARPRPLPSPIEYIGRPGDVGVGPLNHSCMILSL